MKKTIKIEGREIDFDSNGRTMRLYRMYFKKDMLQTLIKMYEFYADKSKKDSKDIDFEFVENIAWICAKTANSDIPDIDEWLSQFADPMSLVQESEQIVGCIVANMESVVKSKKNMKKLAK